MGIIHISVRMQNIMLFLVLLHISTITGARDDSATRETATTTAAPRTTTAASGTTTAAPGTTTAAPGTTTAAPATTTYSPYGCPPGWINSEEGCFFLNFMESVTWMEAQLECELLGGYLAEPKTEEQAALLTSLAYLEQNIVGVQSWWLGLTDRGHEGRWVWQHSVEDAEFVFWAPGSPSESSPDLDCVIMNTWENFMWSNQDCLHTIAAPICQRDVQDMPTTTMTTTSRTTTSRTTTSRPPTTTIGYDYYHIELRGGNGYSSGNVYAVNSQGYFGPVCDNGWSSNDAHVVCRQLGFSTGSYYTNSQFGSVSNFAYNEVGCNGSEQHLRDCPHQTSATNCYQSEGAGVYCD